MLTTTETPIPVAVVIPHAADDLRRATRSHARSNDGTAVSATVDEIKEAYRRPSLRYHPDKCADGNRRECEEMFRKINRANDVLMSYCRSYRFPFAEEDVREATGEAFGEEHVKQFYEDFI
jgi:DnaJ-class molecular chaperone